MAKWLIMIGALLLVIGVLWHFVPGLFSWFGKLPGDIDYQTENTRVFVPITSMIIVSLVLTVLLNLFNR
ncbi:MAG: DUF2905 domain-containing protein [Hydrogenovibrio sp.]